MRNTKNGFYVWNAFNKLLPQKKPSIKISTCIEIWWFITLLFRKSPFRQ